MQTYTHAYKRGVIDSLRWYWAITVEGDHTEFYRKNGYKALKTAKRQGPLILPPGFFDDLLKG